MSRYLDRLHQGERLWAAEAVLRSIGLMLLAGCHRLALLAQRLMGSPPNHPVTLPEFSLCAAIVVLLSSGLALTLEGPGLLRDVPIPRSSAYFFGNNP